MRARVTPPHTVSAADAEAMPSVGVDKLFREHSTYVAAFLRRLGVADEAVDDALQEVFLVAHARGGYRDGPASPRTWLGAITIRIAANARRARMRRRENVDEHALETHSVSITPDTIAEQRETLTLVKHTLLQMSVAHRQAFVQFALDGQTCDAIAQTLGVPTGTVYSRLHAARSSLAAAMKAA